jgi:hypothetical protein
MAKNFKSYLTNRKKSAIPIWIFNSDRIIISDNYTPANATAKGDKGTICIDENFIYVCIARNTWKRVAIASW